MSDARGWSGRELRQEYERLRNEAKRATDEGRIEEALELYDRGLSLAREIGDQDLIDLAGCNRTAIVIALEGDSGAARDLREILSRSANPLNRLTAAYQLARIYELRQDTKKGLLYTRIARGEHDKRGVADPYWEAGINNQMANFLLLESRFGEAEAHYRQALEDDPAASEIRLAATWLNLGYCRLMQEDLDEALALLYRGLRVLRRSRVDVYQMLGYLDLCYAHLEIGRHRSARRHGQRALRLAEELGNDSGIKNALYLLGEAEHLLGRDDRAREHFDRLQTLYPDSPYLADMLLAVDLRKMINLRA